MLLATDATIVKSQIADINGDKAKEDIGAWEESYLERLFIVGNGLYQAGHSNEIKNKTRSYSAANFYDKDTKTDYWKLIRQKAQREATFTIDLPERGFVRLGAALTHVPPLAGWRTWKRTTKALTYGKFKHKIMRDGRLYPAPNPWGDTPSHPYQPKLYRADEDAPLLDANFEDYQDDLVYDANFDVDGQDADLLQSI
jgi:hypothetical protein